MGDGRFSPNRGQFGSRGNINRGNIGNIGFRGGWLFFFKIKFNKSIKKAFF